MDLLQKEKLWRNCIIITHRQWGQIGWTCVVKLAARLGALGKSTGMANGTVARFHVLTWPTGPLLISKQHMLPS